MVSEVKGFTTGTTATAATLAAVQMLLKQEEVLQVKLTTPADIELVILVRNSQFTANSASCSVMKEAESHEDITNGIEICASVTWRSDYDIVIFAGEGVGVVVREGLPIEVGEAAINPVPRRMMMTAARSLIGYKRGVNITISVPKGKLLANKTSNIEAGVEGGISILGTSGIITQCGEEDLKHIISNEIKQRALSKHQELLCVTDYLQADVVSKYTKKPQSEMIYIFHYLEHALLEAGKQGVEKITIIGNISQLMKISVGIFNIHSKNGHPQNEILLANLALAGADAAFIAKVNDMTSLARKIRFIQDSPYRSIFERIIQRVKDELMSYARIHNLNMTFDVLVLLDETKHLISTNKRFTIEYSRTI